MYLEDISHAAKVTLVPIRSKKKPQATVDKLPTALMRIIFSNLHITELREYVMNKKWSRLKNDDFLLSKLVARDLSFGKKQWQKYFGDIGIEPSLPSDIHKTLFSPCPFFPDKQVMDTHMLVLIPQTVDGKPLTLVNFGKLLKDPQEGHEMGFDGSYTLSKKYKDKPIERAHWILMTKEPIPGSRNKSDADLQTLVAKYPDYEIPKILEATVCIFTHYVSSGERLYGNKPWTFTSCQDLVDGHRVSVGGFSRDGLRFYNGYYVSIPHQSRGLGALRKF